MAAGTIASAAGKPVISPPVSEGGAIPVWLDDRAVLVQTILTLVTFITILLKTIFNTEKTRYEKIMGIIEEKFPQVIQRLDSIEDTLKDVPTHDQVELKILRRLAGKDL